MSKVNVKREELNQIFDDLEVLFEMDYIGEEKINDLLKQLKSEEAKYYLDKLVKGSEPEPAFREAFFAGPHSKIARFLGGDINPEVNVETGVIDYLSGTGKRAILLELKPPFDKDAKKIGIKQKELKWQDRKDQILRYIQYNKEFVIITNLKNWYFFNRTTNEENFQPFYSASLKELREQFVSKDLFEFSRRRDRQSISGDLDDQFLVSLKKWVEKLSMVKFDTDKSTKSEIIIGILNKFIFIQTLDDFECVDFQWLRENWEHAEKRYEARGQLRTLEKFFEESIEWFNDYYDTELFIDNPIEYLNKDKENIKKFYQTIKQVLGINYYQTRVGSFMGILQYNFRYIDEDVLGRAYELFLAEQRHDEGIYYTRKEVTQYIVDQTIGKVCNNLLSQISNALEKQNYKIAEENIRKLTSLKILDLSCGSGAFIIKSIRKLWDTYRKINSILLDLENEHSQQGSIDTSIKPSVTLTKLSELKQLLGSKDGNHRELITKILLKHVYGNDLDIRAIQVAKLNIWLEAIRSAPQSFRFKMMIDIHKVLPRLEMNLSNGDALVGLPQDCCQILLDKHKPEIQKLTKLRDEYLNGPNDPTIIDQIGPIKEKLRTELDKEFASYLDEKNIDPKSLNPPFLHWPLEFWHIYYDEKGNKVEKEKRGFDFVLGNPPYAGTQVIVDRKDFYNNEFKNITHGSYDIYILFLQRAVDFLKKLGKLGFIVSNKFLVKSYGKKLIPFLYDNTYIEEFMDLTKCPKVFEDAQVSPIIMISTKEKIVKKEEKETKISLIKKNDVSLIPKVKEIEEEIITNDFSVEFRKHDKLIDSQTGHILLFLTGNDGKLIEKMEKDSDDLKSTCDDLRTGIMGFNYWSIEPLIFEDSSLNDNDDEAKILPPSLIDNYQITWQNDTVDLYKKSLKCPKVRHDDTVINDSTWELYKKPKIVVRGTAQRLTAAIDYDGEYGLLVAAHAIIPKDVKDFEYITGILNSGLLNWFHLKKLMGGQIPQGSLSYPVEFYEKIPIKKSSKHKDEISFCVKNIISLKNAYRDYFEIWKEWSAKIPAIKEKPLREILKDDEEFVTKGDLKWVCFQNVSFYPNTTDESQKEQLKKEYKKISFDYNSHSSSLILRGMEENNEWHNIFVLKLENDVLLEHMYISFVNQFKSRSQIRTLNDFFDKTMIPVLLPIVDKTPNISKIVKAEYAKINTEVPGDLLEIITRLNDNYTKLDALVFQEYGLSKEESISVMSFLSIPGSYQKMILTHIDK